MKLLLDTPVLAKLCHPTKFRDAQTWFYELVSLSPPAHELVVSTISLYEVRRALAGAGAKKSLEQLGELVKHLRWLPVTVETAEQAAELWEQLRLHKRESIERSVSDSDVLMAAHAALEGAVLVSSDRPLADFGAFAGLDVRDWSEIEPGGS